jgi:translocation and assembly module TamB
MLRRAIGHLVRGCWVVFKIVEWTVALVLLLVAIVYIGLQTQPGRDLVAGLVESQVNKTIRGRLTVGRLAQLSLSRVQLDDVVLHDVDDRPVLEVERVLVDLDLLALLQGAVAVDLVAVRRPTVRLLLDESGQYSLLTAIESRAPPEPEPEPEEEPVEAPGEPTPIRVRRIALDGGVVITEAEDPTSRGLGISNLDVRARLQIVDQLVLDLSHLSLTVTGPEGDRLLRLDPLVAHYELGDGVASATLDLHNDSDRVRVRADVAGLAGDGPMRVDTSVLLDHLGTDLLEPLGMGGLRSSLPAWVEGRIDVDGPLDDLDAALDLLTPGGPISLTAEVRDFEDADVRVRSGGLALREVMAGLPEMTVSLDLQANLDTETADEGVTRHLSLRLTDAAVDEQAIPDLELDARVSEEAAVLERLYFPHLGDTFQLTATVGFDGSISAHLFADELDLGAEPHLALFVPELEGTFDADLDVDVQTEGDEPSVHARGHLDLGGVALADLSVASLSVSGSAEGPLLAPAVDLNVDVSRLSAAGTAVRTARLRVQGGPDRYRLDGNLALVDGPAADLDLNVDRAPQRITVDGTLGVTLMGERVSASLDRVALDLDEDGQPQRVGLGRLGIRHEHAELSLGGSYDLTTGSADASVDIRRVDLALFDGRLGLPDLPVGGVLSGRVGFRGTPDDPHIETELALREGRVSEPTELDDIAFDLSLSYSPTHLQSQLRLVAAQDLSVDLDADARLRRSDDPVSALRRARYQARLDLRIDDLALAAAFVPDLPVSGGPVELSLEAAGRLSSPDLTLDLSAQQLAVLEQPPIDVTTRATLNEEALDVEASVLDAGGTVLDLAVGADVDSGELIDDPGGALALLQDASWQLELEIPERALADFPVPIEALGELPVAVSANVNLRGQANQLPTGQLSAAARTQLEDWPAFQERCPASGELWVGVSGEFAPESAEVAVQGLLDGREIVYLTAAPSTPPEEWVADIASALPPLNADLDVRLADLAAMPLGCDEIAGAVELHAELRGLLGDAPQLTVDLVGEGVAVGGSPPTAVDLRVEADGGQATAELVVDAGQQGTLAAQAQVPLRWTADAPAPALGEGSVLATAELTNFAVSGLASLVPVFRRGQGRIDGNLRVEGPLEAPVPSGELRLRDLDVQVPGLDQRLTDVSGRVSLSPESIVIRDFRAEDYGGSIAIDGMVEMAALSPSRARIEIHADEFPMRQAGTIAARLTATTEVDARFSPQENRVSVVLRDVAVQLPEQSAGSVQSLDGNPDIMVVSSDAQGHGHSATELATQQAEPEAAAGSEEPAPPPAPTIVEVDATQPFWVRRSDFAFQLSAQLRIETDQEGARISGEVDLRRGNISLLTKMFELERGSIIFDGGSQIDPILDLVAVHDLARYPGQTVSVSISGRLSRPELAFSTTVPGVTREEQIVQLLVTGRVEGGDQGGQQEAGSQVASMLSGLTAGILTAAAQSQLGGTLPVISVQTGEQIGDVQVRAGFAADRLIPSFLRGIVTGIYVEGFVETSSSEGDEGASSSNPQGGTTGGFLIELYYPNGFVTSASFQPPANWSFDVLWQP